MTIMSDISMDVDEKSVQQHDKEIYHHTTETGPLESEDERRTTRKTRGIITIIGSALANLSDGVQQSLASSTNVVMKHLLGSDVYTSSVQTRISNALLVGAVIGILVFEVSS